MYTIDQINEYLNIMKKLRLEEEKKTSNKCFYENKEITVIDQCGKVELCRDCGIIIQKLLNYKGFDDNYSRCHYKKKSVYKREYYLKKKMILFEEKFDFNFSDEDLKIIDKYFINLMIKNIRNINKKI